MVPSTPGYPYELWTRETLLTHHPYALKDSQKNKALLHIIKEQLIIARRNNRYIDNYFSKMGIGTGSIMSLEDVPFIPVQMFKQFDLKTCPEENISKTLRSSGTTGGQFSVIPLDKTTSMNQIKALKSILSDYLGRQRKIFLVIDHEGINSPALAFSARTAGVRGLSIYAKKTYYLLREENGQLFLNIPVLEEIARLDPGEEVYAFGFTYIIWTVFYEQLKSADIQFSFRDMTLFHGGGWKKMQELAVSKENFARTLAAVFGTQEKRILDFYGMAEQTGIIFVDCEYGNKHVPVFSQVVIRDPFTLDPCDIGKTGLIEVMSILADSYYDQAILTEDLGVLGGVDDCPCGRKGRYFRFVSRVEKAELRGCGDTFRE
jgi:phenylacetate-coenzyme A ligase PaaK-like adenylate-forming protein